MARPKQTDPQFKLRIPAELKGRIERKAHANSRTLSAEILNTLEDHYPPPVSLDEIAKDIEMSVRWMRSLGREATFRVLGDQLYDMLYQISRSEEKPPELRDAAQKIVDQLTERRADRPWAPDYDLPDNFEDID